jgi:hypothetical protein
MSIDQATNSPRWCAWHRVHRIRATFMADPNNAWCSKATFTSATTYLDRAIINEPKPEAYMVSRRRSEAVS